ncbi:MAG: acyltransferase [Planctomycetaceae bacterium]|nr:acyltransferase [Planctomycetaceae bacterium]
MTEPETQPSRPIFGGLDYLRVSAVVLVTIQHAAAIMGDKAWMTWRGLNVGQLGVAIFLAISGFLASQSRQAAWPWLVQRLRRIYPALWIVMVICFWLTWLSGYKQFDAYQVFSQMLGLGFFTHPDHLVNTATWFISLLLVCYVGVFVARAVKAPILMGVASSLGLLVCAFWVPDPSFVVHLFTFSVAFVAGEMVPIAMVSRLLIVAGGLAITLGISLEPLFLGAGLSLTSVGLALRVSTAPRFLGVMADVSYEYYLLHGVFLVGGLRGLPGPLVFRLLVALLSAVIAAKCLRLVTQRIERRNGERRSVK